jgi:hypothetical protein
MGEEIEKRGRDVKLVEKRGRDVNCQIISILL